jgi:hypothetical protein
MLQAAGEYMSGFAHLFATHHAACKQTGLLLSHLACIAQSVFCRLQWHFCAFVPRNLHARCNQK